MKGQWTVKKLADGWIQNSDRITCWCNGVTKEK